MQVRDWLPTAAIIVTIIGAAFVLGSRMATRDDLAAFRAEVRAELAEVRAEIAELRGHFVNHLEGHAPAPGDD